MKKIKSTVSYTVPNWNFCNSDNLINGGELSKNTCRFCHKTKAGHECLLYNVSLSSNDGLINKTRECCKATAGFASTIDEPAQQPVIDPREVMKQTIELYMKNVKELRSQNYPQAMAESLAKQLILGGK